jgi:hypothetical protein
MLIGTDPGALLLIAAILLTLAGICIHLKVGRQNQRRPRTRASQQKEGSSPIT